MHDKSDLVRIVKLPSGLIELDYLGKKDGRGAYICKNTICTQKAVKLKAFNRVFKCQVDNSIYDAIIAQNS